MKLFKEKKERQKPIIDEQGRAHFEYVGKPIMLRTNGPQAFALAEKKRKATMYFLEQTGKKNSGLSDQEWSKNKQEAKEKWFTKMAMYKWMKEHRDNSKEDQKSENIRLNDLWWNLKDREEYIKKNGTYDGFRFHMIPYIGSLNPAEQAALNKHLSEIKL